MTKQQALQKLLDAVEDACLNWQWHPENEYGASEAIIPSGILIDLETAYNEYMTHELTEEER
jgi:hypothetical protein